MFLRSETPKRGIGEIGEAVKVERQAENAQWERKGVGGGLKNPGEVSRWDSKEQNRGQIYKGLRYDSTTTIHKRMDYVQVSIVRIP